MREIKFRAWDKENRAMLYAHEDKEMLTFYNGAIWVKLADPYYPNKSYPKPILMSNLQLMQYTGLCDKNGKEIYEGDIVQTVAPDGTRLSKFVIFWNDNTASFKKERQDGEIYEFDIYGNTLKEVIGNIYENPTA